MTASAAFEPSGAAAFSAAIERQQYDLAALRLLLGVVAAIEASAPATREELITLLTVDRR
jgi:hypothetical protein